MSLRGALEDARLTLLFLPLVARVRWKLWRVPLASRSAVWREHATSQLQAAQTRGAQKLPAFEVWRRAHAIGRAARFVPRASCLTQALALQSVLSGCGEVCSLVLGVDKSAKPGAKINFEAHAWIEWQGRVIIGGNIERWKPLLTITPQSPLTDHEQQPDSKTPASTPDAPALLNASATVQ